MTYVAIATYAARKDDQRNPVLILGYTAVILSYYIITTKLLRIFPF